MKIELQKYEFKDSGDVLRIRRNSSGHIFVSQKLRIYEHAPYDDNQVSSIIILMSGTLPFMAWRVIFPASINLVEEKVPIVVKNISISCERNFNLVRIIFSKAIQHHFWFDENVF